MRSPMLRDIIAATADASGLTSADLTGPSRKHYVAHWRQAAAYVARTSTERSYPFIARYFGGRDHTTILFAKRRVECELASGSAYWSGMVAAIEAELEREAPGFASRRVVVVPTREAGNA